MSIAVITLRLRYARRDMVRRRKMLRPPRRFRALR